VDGRIDDGRHQPAGLLVVRCALQNGGGLADD
jgi:hypothetical protein